MLIKTITLFIISCSVFCSIAQSKGQADLDKAKMHFENYEMDQAKRAAESAVKKDPSLAEAHYVLGAAKYEIDYSSGMEELSKAIELGTKNPDAYARRATLRSYKSDTDGAIADYSEAIKLDAGNWVYYNYRGGMYNLNEQYDLSIKDYTTAIALPESEKSSLYVARAEIYLQQGKLQEALKDASEGVRLFPDGAYSYLIRAGIYEEMGEKAKACEDYKTSMKLADMTEDEYLKEKVKTLCQ